MGTFANSEDPDEMYAEEMKGKIIKNPIRGSVTPLTFWININSTFEILIKCSPMYQPFWCQSWQLLSALSSADVILMAYIANNMDPDLTAPLRVHSVWFCDKMSLE